MDTTKDSAPAVSARLCEFFDPDDIGWLPKDVKKIKDGKVFVIPYVGGKAVQDRLDSACGVANWQDNYTVLPGGDVECRLLVRIDGEWISKSDVGSRSGQPDTGDALKAAYTDALKRAAVKFGVGRYLASIPRQYAPYDGYRITQIPELPDEFLPPHLREIGREDGSKLSGLLATICEKRKLPVHECAVNLLAYRKITFRDSSKLTPTQMLARIIRRDYAPWLTSLNAWLNSVASNAAPPEWIVKALSLRPEPSPAVSPPPVPAPSPKTHADNLPRTGEELHRRLIDFDVKLASEKKCVRGALLARVVSTGAMWGFSVSMSDWDATQIARACEWAQEFAKSVEPRPMH